VSQCLGEALLEQEKQLFQYWYQVRDGTCSRLVTLTLDISVLSVLSD
jgi:hypothetical protein